jgi:hypothetical protein
MWVNPVANISLGNIELNYSLLYIESSLGNQIERQYPKILRSTKYNQLIVIQQLATASCVKIYTLGIVLFPCVTFISYYSDNVYVLVHFLIIY